MAPEEQHKFQFLLVRESLDNVRKNLRLDIVRFALMSYIHGHSTRQSDNSYAVVACVKSPVLYDRKYAADNS